MTDSKLIAENILIPLFKLVYGYDDLVNLNVETANHPAVDLADKPKQLAIQVTSTADLDKIKTTLSKFFAHKLDISYRRVIIYCLSDKQKSYSEKAIHQHLENLPLKTQADFHFDVNNDIQDHSDFLNKISKINDIDTIEAIEVLLERHFGPKAADRRLKKIHPIAKLRDRHINRLFDQGLVYLDETESTMLSQIIEQFTDTNNQAVLITGGPATGKSILAMSTARVFAAHGINDRAAYVLKLSQSNDWANIQDDLHNLKDSTKNRLNLIIVEDCHQNLEIATRIYYEQDDLPQCRVVFTSRTLSQKAINIEGEEDDIFTLLDNQTFALTLTHDHHFASKSKGIIKQYQKHYQGLQPERTFNIGNVETVLNHAGRNYLYLGEILDFWDNKDVTSLDQIDEPKLLEEVYERYLTRQFESQQQTILQYAAINQFEIPMLPLNEDKPAFRQFRDAGLVEDHSDSQDFYTFHHSEFARLILKAFYSRNEFRQAYDSEQSHTTEALIRYITGHPNSFDILSQVFNMLNANQEIKILGQLFDDVEASALAKNLYLNHSTLGQLYYLFIILENNTQQSKIAFFADFFTIKSQTVAIFLKKNPPLGNMHIFAFILCSLGAIDVQLEQQLFDQFTDQDLTALLHQSNLTSIGQALSTLRKASRDELLTHLLSLIPQTVWLEKATQVDFNHFGYSLAELNMVNPQTAAAILSTCFNDQEQKARLLQKATQVDFTRFGHALADLNTVNPQTAAAILSACFNDQEQKARLLQKATQVDFNHFGCALAELNMVNSQTAADILSTSFNDKEQKTLLLQRATQVDFTRFGHALADLNTVNPQTAADILSTCFNDQEQKARLLQKATQVDFTHFGNALADLNAVNPQTAADILSACFGDKEQKALLLQKATRLGFAKLAKALADTRKANTEVATAIFEQIDVAKLSQQIPSAKYTIFLYNTAILTKLSPKKMKHILANIPTDYLIQPDNLYDVQWFNNLFYSLQQCDMEDGITALIDVAQQQMSAFWFQKRNNKLTQLALLMKNLAPYSQRYPQLHSSFVQQKTKIWEKVAKAKKLGLNITQIPFYIGAVHDLFPDVAECLFDLTAQTDYFSEQFQGEVIYQIGLSFQRQSDHHLALNELTESLDIFTINNDTSWQISTYLAMADSYAESGNEQAALIASQSAEALESATDLS